MHFNHLAFALATNFLFLSLCAAPPVAQQAGADRFEVRGKVINTATGEPVGGALVQIFESAKFSEADGTFVFAGLPRGRSSVLARKPGFFSDQELGGGMAGGDSSIDVPADSAIEVKLTPEAIIYGEVKNADGEPMDGINVTAQRWQVVSGRRQLQAARDASTDDQGNFRLAELMPGKYYLTFQPANRGWRTQNELKQKTQMEDGYGPQFYPGVADAASASVFEIRAGAQVHVTHTFLRQRLFEVSGAVRGANGQPFSLLLVSSAGDVVQRDVRINSQTGQFQIPGIPAGNYMLTATMPLTRTDNAAGPDPPPLTAMLPLHVTSDLSGVVLPLGTGIFVGVQVRDELARAGPEPHQVLLRMIPKEFAQFAPAIIVPPLPGNPAGQSRFENLSPGIYSVEASPQQGPHDYVASLRCGNVDLLRDDLVIAPGAAPPPIEVTLRDDGAQLNLTVKAKAKPAAVVLYSEEYPRRSFLLPFNPTASSVSVSNLPPGTYKLLAVTGAVDLEFRNPAAMERYLSHARSVTLQPGDNTSAFVETQEVAEQPQ